MGRGLWSQEIPELPSPHTSSTTRLASEENTDFLHLVNEDTDAARLLHTQGTNCNAVNRVAELQSLVDVDVPCLATNTQNKNGKANIRTKVIL